MAHIEIPSNVRRTLQISVVLMAISTFAIIILGIGLLSINQQNKSLESFMKNAVNVQPNFEQSLVIYTEKTKNIITYLLGLRPDEEKDYVQFISDIESIGRQLGLDVDVQSLEAEKLAKGEFIFYELSFMGNLNDMKELLKKIEEQNYYVGVERVEYRDISLLIEENSDKSKNIDLIIKLFIKP